MHISRTLGLAAMVVMLVVGSAWAQQADPPVDPVPAATATPAAAPSSTASAAPAASATSAPAASASAPAAETAMDGQTYTVRLRDLQQRIDALKEQIRRSHTRLSLLSETILSGGGSGARANLLLENKMSKQFKLTRALVVLDGAVQYNKSDETGALSEQSMIPIFNGPVPPGDHTVQVLVNLRGHGYGVFSYLRGYRFEVRSSHSFTAVEGKTSRLRILAFEKGGVTTPLEERPAVRFLEKIVSGLVEGDE